MKASKRGEFNYINTRKKRIIFMAIFIVAVAVAIFGIGLLLNKMDKANVFTVVAVCAVLPWAKQIVALVVIFPYHSVSQERYEKVREIVPKGTTLYTDLVITSTEKIMNLDFAVVGHGRVIALLGKEGQDMKYIRDYLAKGVSNCSDYKVKLVNSEKAFLTEVANLSEKEVSSEEEERVNAYLRSLIV